MLVAVQAGEVWPPQFGIATRGLSYLSVRVGDVVTRLTKSPGHWFLEGVMNVASFFRVTIAAEEFGA